MLDEALPSEDPSERYAEACRRFEAAVRTVRDRGAESSMVYPGLYGVLRAPEEVVEDVLTMEGELLASASSLRSDCSWTPGCS